MQVAIVGDEQLHEIKTITNDLVTANTLKLKQPCRYLSIGFPYKSIMQTFPLIFPDEVEHMPKFDAEIGIKLYNTKGGYITETTDNGNIERQHVTTRYIDIDHLTRYMSRHNYLAIKEVANALSPLNTSCWVHFTTRSAISPDIACTFVVDKPVPAAILKIYAKAKVLAGYRGL